MLNSKVRLASVILIKYSSVFILAMTFAISSNCCKCLNFALNSDTFSFGCHKSNNTFFTPCQMEVTANMERNTAMKHSGTMGM